MTKYMKHGRLRNVALGLRPCATFSTSGSSYFNVTLTTVHHLYNDDYDRRLWRYYYDNYYDYMM